MESSALRRADFFLLSLLTILSLAGIVVLRGATVGQAWLEPAAVRQTAWLCIGIVAFFLALAVDYHHLEALAYGFYLFHLGALGWLLGAGRSIKGAKSWFGLGFFNWQPSETMKIAVALILAKVFASAPGPPRKIRDLLLPLALTLVPAAMVAAQPDLGSAAIYAAVFWGMLYWSGAPRKILVGLIALGLACAAAAYPFLKPYQRDRILVFLNPEADPLGKGYNLLQAKITLGSGQGFGHGWGQGLQSNLGYLPEHHTDFIYSSLGEQFGFFGCLAILLLYALIAWRALGVVGQARDRTGALIAGGMLSIFLAHLGINLGMTLGFLPVTGLPLPFFSAGGSALVTHFLLFGLICNVGLRKYVFPGA